MRTTLRPVLALLATLVLSMMLVAGPAIATEVDYEAEHEPTSETTDEMHEDAPADGEHAAEEDEGFGSGQWDGLMLAAIVGIVLGTLMFADTKPGSIPKADAHH